MPDHKSKKRKVQSNHDTPTAATVDTSRPSAIFKPTKGRSHTVSIALPGSIIANALTHDQKTALAGQIARACAVFCVDEIIVFDDGQAEIRAPEQGGYTAYADPNFFLFHILSYLETPPHLRRALFPMHPDLRTAGALPSLDMPHHLRSEEWCRYREAVAVGQGRGGAGAKSSSAGSGGGTWLDCGLQRQVHVDVPLEDRTRVTVRLPDHAHELELDQEVKAVSPETPRQDLGYYWGYSVRQAASLSAVFTECPYDGGYDMSIGTSERGASLRTLSQPEAKVYLPPTWQHLLLVFGGVSGLEAALSADAELQAAGVMDASELFDRWINMVPGQGSRTMRTEEAVWVGLAGLRPLIELRDNL